MKRSKKFNHNNLHFFQKTRGHLSIKLLNREGLNNVDVQGGVLVHDGETSAGEELLLFLAGDDLNDTRLELGNRGNVVGQNTHVSSSGRDVDLVDLSVSNQGLYVAIQQGKRKGREESGQKISKCSSLSSNRSLPSEGAN